MSCKPDGDSTESKKFTVRTTFTNVRFGDIVVDAIRTDNIRYQRDVRKLFDTLDNGATLERVYGAKPSTHVTEEMMRDAYVTMLKTLTPDERRAQIEKDMMD